MNPVYHYTFRELTKIVNDLGMKKFRGEQIFYEIYKRYNLDFENMTSISKTDRKRLKKVFGDYFPNLIKKAGIKNTIKYSLNLQDGSVIETVLIKADKRVTQCVSSQVGCTLGCRFCATAQMGYIRSLTPAEYVEQILFLCSELGSRPTNLVFMGMGEPLLNTENLIRTIKIITDDRGLDFGLRKITVSTAGILTELEVLLREFPNLGIAISLNAPNDQLREKLMPIGKEFSVTDIFKFLNKKKNLFKRRPTLEYILIKDINDSDSMAEDLLTYTNKVKCKINLIPFNPFEECDFQRPSRERIEKFREILMTGPNAVTLRESAGSDINAACGQLAWIENKGGVNGKK